MESIQSRFYKAVFRLINSKNSMIKGKPRSGLYGLFYSPEPPRSFYKKFTIKKRQINGRNIFIINSDSSRNGKTVLYLHGGAYVNNTSRYHWRMISRLINKTGCTFVVPDYPLAPLNTYHDSFDMVKSLYRELAGIAGCENLVLMGDSAGGGFALALAMLLGSENSAQPSRIILLSPWLDITLNNPEIMTVDRLDPFLGIEGCRMAGISYAGSDSPENYMLSPINGPVEGLAALSIFIGTHDILEPDCRRFRSLAGSAGVKIDYHEYPGMFHVWMLFRMPEAEKAIGEIERLLV